MQGGLKGLFSAAFGTMGAAALAVDHEGRVVAGNAAFEAMFGTSSADCQGLSFTQLCIDLGSEVNPASLTSELKGRTPARHRYRRRDGTIFWGERTDAPVHGGDGTCIGVFSMI